jgi:hypothetical protein
VVIHAPSRVWFWPGEDEKITEVTATFREMGTFRCDGCGELLSIVHNPLLADRWVAGDKRTGWKKFLLKSMSVSRNIVT